MLTFSSIAHGSNIFPIPRSALALAATLAVGAAVFCGCSGGDDDSSSDPQSASQAGAAGAAGVSGAGAGGGAGAAGSAGSGGGGGAGAAGAAGAAGGPGGPPPAGFENVDGIYAWTSHTSAKGSCDAEGPSESPDDPFFLVSRITLGGTKYLRAVSCGSVSDCMKKKDATAVSGSFIDSFPYSNDTETTFKTTMYHSGFAMNGTCIDGGVEQLTATKDVTTGTFRIESRLETAPYPAGSGNSCDSKSAKAAAAGQPCSRLEVVQGQFVQPI